MKTECRKCSYFYITWDPQMPYGCNGLGFKSKNLPSYEVLSASGKECLKYKKKNFSGHQRKKHG